MPFTQADLVNFDAQVAVGAKRVRAGDKEVESHDVDGILKLRNLIVNDIAQQTGPQQVRQVQIYTRSGWGS
jgi:hypothetical protein